jgi:hypothetical protein
MLFNGKTVVKNISLDSPFKLKQKQKSKRKPKMVRNETRRKLRRKRSRFKSHWIIRIKKRKKQKMSKIVNYRQSNHNE